jgi:signal transduction histidine kinase
MSSSSSGNGGGEGRAALEQVFPFFFTFGPDLRLKAAGPSLRKIVPAAVPGAALYALFAPKRPVAELAFADLQAQPDRLFTLTVRERDVLLRGQFVRLGLDLMFVGSPWIAETDDLRHLGLTLNDFAAFDPTLELLQLVQIQKAIADDLKGLTARLTAQAAELAAAARTKDAFLSSMRHELRTPLTGILGLTEILVDQSCGPVNERQLRYLGLVQQSGQRLMHLLNNILDFTQLGSERQPLELELCPLQEVCSLALQRVRPAVERLRQVLRAEVGPAEGLRVKGDRRRLVQVVGHLLENASKFTPAEGEIGLTVRRDGATVRIEVWDRGIGIAERDQPKLFQPFTQVDGRTNRSFEGAGLGLALSERIVRLHGGRIEVVSAAGAGSTFAAVLPLEPAAG